MEKNPQFMMIAYPLHSPDRMISLIFREYYSGIRRILLLFCITVYGTTTHRDRPALLAPGEHDERSR